MKLDIMHFSFIIKFDLLQNIMEERMFKVRTSGVCASEIHFEIDDGFIKQVEFIGGCPGNAIGLSNMLAGQPVADVVEKLRDVRCGGKNTSCPSQLAKALEAHI